ncbi:hypothetical protein EHS13_09565 [Paenibacillus psychroresistens]|uniref:2Fe-2S ferredoxin-type domain-containing protein n=1 Tax=Paenibacillus psychroresistens TaxID=1778678 RepID=A0A6B8RHN9_9BACL|nr:2Fe-2S iron-sulfur cluster-binding protein [Paenibacillus psychroresistens]QGQ95115.1 hypothetical protein EHS13_09565 [Paenibacillus psychroresistens]
MPTHQITFLPTGVVFEANEEETILEAALRQGIKPAFSCRSGTCRSCLYQIVIGHVSQEDLDYILLSKEEWAAGRRLICCSRPKSDTILEKPNQNRKKIEL